MASSPMPPPVSPDKFMFTADFFAKAMTEDPVKHSPPAPAPAAVQAAAPAGSKPEGGHACGRERRRKQPPASQGTAKNGKDKKPVNRALLAGSPSSDSAGVSPLDAAPRTILKREPVKKPKQPQQPEKKPEKKPKQQPGGSTLPPAPLEQLLKNAAAVHVAGSAEPQFDAALSKGQRKRATRNRKNSGGAHPSQDAAGPVQNARSPDSGGSKSKGKKGKGKKQQEPEHNWQMQMLISGGQDQSKKGSCFNPDEYGLSEPQPAPVTPQPLQSISCVPNAKSSHNQPGGSKGKKGKPKSQQQQPQPQPLQPEVNWQMQMLIHGDQQQPSPSQQQQQQQQQQGAGKKQQSKKKGGKSKGQAQPQHQHQHQHQNQGHKGQRKVKAHPGHLHLEGHLHPSGKNATNFAADTYSAPPAPSVLPMPGDLLSPTSGHASENLLGMLTRAMVPGAPTPPASGDVNPDRMPANELRQLLQMS